MFAITVSALRQDVITLAIACFIHPTLGAFDIVRCCVKAARDENIYRRSDIDSKPWNVCHFGGSVQYPEGAKSFWPSIPKTRAWCKAECSGYQISETSQWLQPLASWIAPYIAVMLLVPIGEGSEKEDLEEDRNHERDQNGEDQVARRASDTKPTTLFGRKVPAIKVVKAVWKFSKTVLGEYILILGDPASALWGAFSEVMADCRVAGRLNHEARSWLHKSSIFITILAGDTKFNSDRLLKGFKDNLSQEVDVDIGPNGWKELAKQVATPVAPQGKTSAIDPDDDAILRSKNGLQTTTIVKSGQNILANELRQAIDTVVKGRIAFSKGIFLPVMLTIAVAASVFFDGYGKLGDKDTAHALAYGVWYSWFITLCVAANCFATSTNVGLARKAFGNSLRLSHRRVSLSQRYVNQFEWNRWLWTIEHANDEEVHTASEPVQNAAFWLRFLVGQLSGWACVGFACACAAVISWTTPTVGLGCRSFNFVLYGVGTFYTAVAHVYCEQLRCKRSKSRLGLLEKVLLYAYWVIVIFNAAVMVIGTILHLSGVFRSCWCSRIFANDNTMIEFQRNTELAHKNAKSYWLVTGYVAFSFVWIVCSFCVAARKYIVWKIEQALGDN